MTMPFYVSPEQIMKDRADYARKGIARGRSVVVVQYADGIAVRRREPVAGAAQDQRDLRPDRASPRSASTTSSRTCGSPASGCADLRGYSYDRRDVTGRGLANAYAQTLGTIFTSGREALRGRDRSSPRSATRAEDDQIYRLTYDGSVADEHGFVVMGGGRGGSPRRTSRSATATGITLAEALRARGGGPRAHADETGDARPGHPGRRARGRRARPHPHRSRASSAGSARRASRRCSATGVPPSTPSSRAARTARRRRLPSPSPSPSRQPDADQPSA